MPQRKNKKGTLFRVRGFVYLHVQNPVTAVQVKTTLLLCSVPGSQNVALVLVILAAKTLKS